LPRRRAKPSAYKLREESPTHSRRTNNKTRPSCSERGRSVSRNLALNIQKGFQYPKCKRGKTKIDFLLYYAAETRGEERKTAPTSSSNKNRHRIFPLPANPTRKEKGKGQPQYRSTKMNSHAFPPRPSEARISQHRATGEKKKKRGEKKRKEKEKKGRKRRREKKRGRGKEEKEPVPLRPLPSDSEKQHFPIDKFLNPPSLNAGTNIIFLVREACRHVSICPRWPRSPSFEDCRPSLGPLFFSCHALHFTCPNFFDPMSPL